MLSAINNINLLFSSVQDFGINRTLSDRLEGMSAELLTPVASATKVEVQKSHILPTCMKVAAEYVCESGRRGGLIVSALDSGASSLGSSPGRGHCVVFLGKALYCHGASLSTQVYKWAPANLMLVVTLLWTSIPSRGE